MTRKQAENYNRMLIALRTISRAYMSPEQLKRDVEKGNFNDYHEYLEMAYENIQSEAANAIRGIRTIIIKQQQNEVHPQTD